MLGFLEAEKEARLVVRLTVTDFKEESLFSPDIVYFHLSSSERVVSKRQRTRWGLGGTVPGNQSSAFFSPQAVNARRPFKGSP